ncbi:MAG: T9SS type A sorting domain-containing protein [Candidatus Azobacteroides sp.]|nr:T9SS type A sorting domain-containing protein [Candidatus Azobacteroides sp.]
MNLNKSSIISLVIGILFPFFQLSAEEFPFSFSQIIQKIKVNGNEIADIGTMKKMFDQEEATSYEFSELTDGKVSIEVELEYPIILTVYALAAPGLEQEDFESWKVEYSLDGISDWKEIEQAKSLWDATVSTYGSLVAFRTDASGDANFDEGEKRATKFYRLTATGTESVFISEWQLHGVPFVIDRYNAFLPDIISADDDRFLSGEDKAWGLENIYDGQLGTKLEADWTQPDNDKLTIEYTVGNGGTEKAASFLLTTWWDKRGRHPQGLTLSGYNGTEYVELYTVDSGVTGSAQRTLFPSVDGNTATTLVFDIPEALQDEYFKYKLEIRSGWEQLEFMQWKLYPTAAPVYPDPEGPGTGMENIQEETFRVYGEKGNITVVADQAASFSIYNTLGEKMVAGNINTGTSVIPVSPGIYIVLLNNTCTKVMVK